MMHFSVIAPRAASVHQEPVPLHFRFTSGETAMRFPYEYDSLDVLTLCLYDASGRPIGRGANGWTRELRLGLEPSPGDARSLITDTLPAATTIEWSEDLLCYFDPPLPGDYSVSARLRFAPAGIDVETERCAITILPLHLTGWDLLADEVATGVLHVAQQHRSIGDAGPAGRGAFFQFRSIHNPAQSWSGVSVSPPPPAAPCRITEADFATRDSYDHDFVRWLIWLSSQTQTLSVVRVRDTEAGEIRQQALEFRAEWAGRPVQHEDGSATVFATDPTTRTLRRIDLSAAGEVMSTRVIARDWRRVGAGNAGAVVATAGGSDRQGRYFLLSAAADGRFPLHLLEISDDATTRSRFLPEPGLLAGQSARVFAVRLELKQPATAASRVLVAGVSAEGPGSHRLWVAESELGLDPQWRVLSHAFTPPPGAEVLAAAAVHSARSGAHAAFLLHDKDSSTLLHMTGSSGLSTLPLERNVGGRVELAVLAGRVCAFVGSESGGVQPFFLEPALGQ